MSERDDARDEAARAEAAQEAAREDALWRSIVDNYGERASLEAEPGTEGGGDTAGRTESDPGAGSDLDRDRDVLDAWDDPDDTFVPPTPPPVPRPEPPRLLAWAGVIGVPVLTVLLAAVSVPVPSWASLLALCWFVGGFGYLVATMRRDSDDDDEWDDGAVL